MTELVGIANITPDSFSGDGHAGALVPALEHIERIYVEGAVMADIGAESTRPGAAAVSAEEEWSRLEPVASWLPYDRPVSLDTYHAETVHRAVRMLGNVTINDVTGLYHPGMVEAVAAYGLHCIVGHLPAAADGVPGAAHHVEPITSVLQVRDELLARRDTLIRLGIPANHIVLDPGIGFGKTQETNRDLLLFSALVPTVSVMIGYSRKKFLGEDRFSTRRNLDAGMVAVHSGATYLRVHEVLPHKQRFVQL